MQVSAIVMQVSIGLVSLTSLPAHSTFFYTGLGGSGPWFVVPGNTSGITVALGSIPMWDLTNDCVSSGLGGAEMVLPVPLECVPAGV